MKTSTITPFALKEGVASVMKDGIATVEVPLGFGRRCADISPASRSYDNLHTPPTSPKIHELLERNTQQSHQLGLEATQTVDAIEVDGSKKTTPQGTGQHSSPRNFFALEGDSRMEHLEDSFFNSSVITHTFMPDGDFTLTYMSGNVKRILGYDPDEFIYDKDFWINHIHPDDVSSVIRNFHKLFDCGHLLQEYRFKHANNHWLWMREELRLVRDTANINKEIIGSWVDISDLCQARDETSLAVMYGVYRNIANTLQELAQIDANKNVEAITIKRQCTELIHALSGELARLEKMENVTWARVESLISHTIHES